MIVPLTVSGNQKLLKVGNKKANVSFRFEARGCGHEGHKKEVPAQVLNTTMAITKGN